MVLCKQCHKLKNKILHIEDHSFDFYDIGTYPVYHATIFFPDELRAH